MDMNPYLVLKSKSDVACFSQRSKKCLMFVFMQRVTEIENMRHKVIEVRQEVFNHNEHEVSKRWAFEEGVCGCKPEIVKLSWFRYQR